MVSKVKNLDRVLRVLARTPQAVKLRMQAANAQSAADMASIVRAHAPVLKTSHKARRGGEVRDSVGSCQGTPPGFRGKLSPRDDAVINAGLRYSVYAGGETAWWSLSLETGRKAEARRKLKLQRHERERGLVRWKRAVSALRPMPFFWPAIRLKKKLAKSRQYAAVRFGLKDGAATP